MKRLFILATLGLSAALACGFMRAKQSLAMVRAGLLQEKQSALMNESAAIEVERAKLQQTIRDQKATRVGGESPKTLSPALTVWLLAGNFSEIPAALVAELRAELGISGNTGSDFVLLSKPTLRTLSPPSPRAKDKLPDSFCALLAIDPQQKQQIESALGGARAEFAVWARDNLRRDGPGSKGPEGETLVSYVLPMDPEVCGSLSNRVMSAVADSLGVQRAELFRTYSDTWFQIEMGYLGGVTNTLRVLRQPSGLCYELRRQGPMPFGQMSEGPGLIDQKYFPPAWRNIFPGGWAEVSQREGFELPQKPAR